MSFTTKCDVKLKYFCNFVWEVGWLVVDGIREREDDQQLHVCACYSHRYIFIIVQICEMMMDFNDCREDELSLRITRSAGGN